MKEGRTRTSGKAGRRLAGLLLLAALMLTAGACGGKPAGETAGEDTARTPHIQPAQLTQEEQALVDLMGSDAACRLFEFDAGGVVSRARIQVYQLTDGAWNKVSGVSTPILEERGRVALNFDNMQDGLRMAVQHGELLNDHTYTPEQGAEASGGRWVTAQLTQRQELAGEEIPLAIQIITDRQPVSDVQLEDFFRPEEYAAGGYECVYAVTAEFE